MTELTSEHFDRACTRYVELIGTEDLDSLMDLFADDCTVEDPAGSDKLVGKEAARAFYATLPDAGVKAKLVGPVHAVPAARAAAFPFEIDTAGMAMSVIDVMTFDEEGKITSMTAYWKM